MIKTVRYLKGGRIKKMAKVYADILVKLGIVVYVEEPEVRKEPKDFRNEIVQTVVKESPVIKDEVATFVSKPKVAAKPKTDRPAKSADKIK